MKRITKRLIVASVASLLVGCSALEGNPLERVGNGVLGLFGAQPATEEFGGKESLVQAVPEISRESEYFLGRAVGARIMTAYPLVKDPELQRYVNEVGRAVAAFSDMPDVFGGYRFGVLDSAEINAISAPGGFIFLSSGMLTMLRDEDALAAVLAHEVAHVARKHGIRAISEEQDSPLFKAAGLLAGGLTCNEVLADAALVLGAAVDNVYDVLLERGYSREFEYEADADAVKILARAGYDPAAMVEVLAEFERRGLSGGGGWFSTHPSGADRQSQLLSGAGVTPLQAESSAREKRKKRFMAIVEPAQLHSIH